MTNICQNKKAHFRYFIEDLFQAGIVLQGWEIKAIRAKRAQIGEAHIRSRNGEIWLINMNISPLLSASTHIKPEATRTRKLLLKKSEIDRLIGKVECRGYTIIPLQLIISGAGFAKLIIALARGKKIHDKRETEKNRDWERQKQAILREKNKRNL